ncbi:hypothetical protein B6I21_08105 [candidate division KSB1 bacterium 4572_119]|nr:MAG: hypothetical protein B6I21_08105 [candidate division KSB1 bacterium 4572_119]
MKTKFYIGPAGWSYKDWDGIVYPPKKDKNFDQLKYLAGYFNTIEINSSFYHPPAMKTLASWVRRVGENPDFLFSYKLWQGFTHKRNSFPGQHDEVTVKSGLDVLRDNGKLGATLVQFPWSFKNTVENKAWLEKVLDKFKEYSPVVEVRHQSWNEESFFDFLNDYQAGFANIDQPVIGESIPLTSFTLGKIGYLRLHGRNYKNWFGKDATVTSRYDYLYDKTDLQQIRKNVENMMENSSKIFIIYNNHYRGQAVANGLQTMFFMDNSKINVPQSLLEHYPQLSSIAVPVDIQHGQTDLF